MADEQDKETPEIDDQSTSKPHGDIAPPIAETVPSATADAAGENKPQAETAADDPKKPATPPKA